MEYKSMFTVYAVVLIVIGGCLFLIPGPFIQLYGANLDAAGLAMSRFYGVSMLGVAWMVWAARVAEPSPALTGLVQGNILIWVLSAGVAVLGQIQRVFNLVGLSVVFLSLLFLSWYAIIRYRQA